MAKTAQERQQLCREKRKHNKESYEKYKESDRQRKRKWRNALSDSELQNVQKQVKRAVENYRKRNTPSTDNSNTSLRDCSSAEQIYTPASFGRAKRKALKGLPKEPSRRAALLKTLAEEELDARFVPLPQHGNRTAVEKQNRVKTFYESDLISRVMPGKRDYVTLWNGPGNKDRFQKRHLLLSLAESYEIFKKDNPDVEIGKSKFMNLRPKWVLLSSQMPHNVYGCIYHSNIILLLEALHRKCPDVIPLYSREEFLGKCVCNLSNETCMIDECQACSDGNLFKLNFVDKVNESDLITWYQWGTNEHDKFLQKEETHGSVSDALSALSRLLPQFKWHSFVKTHQAAAYAADKRNVIMEDGSVCLLQMDFAENYTCSWQDEIQSAHWRQNQVTIYTVMIYFRQKILSYIIVSDSLDHEKHAVAAFTSRIMEMIRNELPNVTTVHVWTDGPSSQYKNKFIFTLIPILQETSGLQIVWNYFATSHGKGPNDALGGMVKRHVYRRVMSRQVVVNNATAFADTCVGLGSIVVLQMNKDEISRSCRNLGVDKKWEGLKGFPGTMTTHCVTATSTEVSTKFYTHAGESKIRQIKYQLPSPDVGFGNDTHVPAVNQGPTTSRSVLSTDLPQLDKVSVPQTPPPVSSQTPSSPRDHCTQHDDEMDVPLANLRSRS